MIIDHPIHQMFRSFPAITGPVTCSFVGRVAEKKASSHPTSRTRSPAIETPYGARIFQSLPTSTQMKGSTTIIARIVLLTPHIVKGDSGVSGISRESLDSLTRGPPASLGAGSETARCGKPLARRSLLASLVSTTPTQIKRGLSPELMDTCYKR